MNTLTTTEKVEECFQQMNQRQEELHAAFRQEMRAMQFTMLLEIADINIHQDCSDLVAAEIAPYTDLTDWWANLLEADKEAWRSLYHHEVDQYGFTTDGLKGYDFFNVAVFNLLSKESNPHWKNDLIDNVPFSMS